MAKVSVTFELDNVTESKVNFDLKVWTVTSGQNVVIAQDSVVVDVPTVPAAPTSLSHLAPVVS